MLRHRFEVISYFTVHLLYLTVACLYEYVLISLQEVSSRILQHLITYWIWMPFLNHIFQALNKVPKFRFLSSLCPCEDYPAILKKQTHILYTALWSYKGWSYKEPLVRFEGFLKNDYVAGILDLQNRFASHLVILRAHRTVAKFLFR